MKPSTLQPGLIATFIATLAFCATGCSSGSSAGAYPVTGEVFVAGQPAAGARIILAPMDKEAGLLAACGTVDERGVFRLTTRTANDGALPGKYRIGITWEEFLGREEGESRYGPDKLQGRYADVEKSPLQVVTIEAQKNNLARFDLSN